jgi:hypothetical protein
VTERFHRSDRGHLQISVTIDDPKSYTATWTTQRDVTAWKPNWELGESLLHPGGRSALVPGEHSGER